MVQERSSFASRAHYALGWFPMYHASSMNEGTTRRTYRLATWNLENFCLLLDRDYSRQELEALDEDAYRAMNSSIYNPNKERSKIVAIAETIKAGNYDVVGLCEVGGLESLENFNRIFLDDEYECFLHQENSRRGIFAGALVRRGSFKRVQARNQSGQFSRNLLRLDLLCDRGTLHVFVLHLKSQLGQDMGIEQRAREIARLCSILPRRRCVVMGDFNGLAIRGQAQFEFEPFLELPFRDVLEAGGVPEEQRYTHFYFSDTPHFNQLDYIFVSNDLPVIGGGTADELVPVNFEQRKRLPSDHLLLEATVAFV